jgi:hypothetical protein
LAIHSKTTQKNARICGTDEAISDEKIVPSIKFYEWPDKWGKGRRMDFLHSRWKDTCFQWAISKCVPVYAPQVGSWSEFDTAQGAAVFTGTFLSDF